MDDGNKHAFISLTKLSGMYLFKREFSLSFVNEIKLGWLHHPIICKQKSFFNKIKKEFAFHVINSYLKGIYTLFHSIHKDTWHFLSKLWLFFSRKMVYSTFKHLQGAYFQYWGADWQMSHFNISDVQVLELYPVHVISLWLAIPLLAQSVVVGAIPIPQLYVTKWRGIPIHNCLPLSQQLHSTKGQGMPVYN